MARRTDRPARRRLLRRLRIEHTPRLLELQEGLCPVCGVDLTKLGPYQVHIDHIKPVAKGGEEEDPENLQLLCKRCNERKGERMTFPSRLTRTPAEARKRREDAESRSALWGGRAGWARSPDVFRPSTPDNDPPG